MQNNINYEKEALLFKALMHPVRLAILDILRNGEECVCHINAILGYRQAYISQQLSVLRDSGIVDIKRDGLNIYYRVVIPEVFGIVDSVRSIMGNDKLEMNLKPLKCDCPKCKCEIPITTGT